MTKEQQIQELKQLLEVFVERMKDQETLSMIDTFILQKAEEILDKTSDSVDEKEEDIGVEDDNNSLYKRVKEILDKEKEKEDKQKKLWDEIVPLNPYPYYPQPHDWYPRKCSKCGIELHDAMWYVCSYEDCPSGLGGYKFGLT